MSHPTEIVNNFSASCWGLAMCHIHMMTSYLQRFPPTHCGSHLRSQISFCAGVCDGALLKLKAAWVDPTGRLAHTFNSCLSGQQKDQKNIMSLHSIHVILVTITHFKELLIGIGCFEYSLHNLDRHIC